jgi:hypothetical protein
MRIPLRSSFAGFLILSTLVVGGVLVAQEYQQVATAETTTGTVQTAEIETYTRTRPALWGQTEYEPNVSYTYTVDGTRYRSSEVYVGHYSSTNSGRRMATATADYTVGESVTVHYTPDDPDEAFLVPRYSFLPGYALVAFGVLLGGEYLTPGTWLLDFVRERFQRASDRGNPQSTRRDDVGPTPPGWDETADAYEWETTDSATDESVTASTESESAGGARFEGQAALAVWALAGLAVLGVVAHYLVFSVAPYSGLATVATVVGVGFPIARVLTEG